MLMVAKFVFGNEFLGFLEKILNTVIFLFLVSQGLTGFSFASW